MTDKLYKLARPLMTGVKLELVGGIPRKVLADGKHEPVRNQMINEILGGLPNFTGELVVGKPHEDCSERSLEFVDHPTAINLFVFWVYDAKLNTPMNLRERLNIAGSMIESCGVNVQWVEHEILESLPQLEEYKRKVIDENFFPGIVLREPFGTYGTEDEIIRADESTSRN